MSDASQSEVDLDALLPAVVHEKPDADPARRPVGLPGASQAAGVPDIHYLWGPGRLLAQQMQYFSAALVFVSLPFFVFSLYFASIAMLESGGWEAPRASVAWDDPRHPANRRPVFGVRSPVLHVNGQRFSPADPSIDWRRVSAPPRSRVAQIAQQAVRDLPTGDPWASIPLRRLSIHDFWRTPIPFDASSVGSIASIEIDGIEWTLIGTYASDLGFRPTRTSSSAEAASATASAALPPAVPVILVQRVDRRSRAPQNRYRIWQLADPALADSIRSTIGRPETMIHDLLPGALADVWERLAPGVSILPPR